MIDMKPQILLTNKNGQKVVKSADTVNKSEETINLFTSNLPGVFFTVSNK